MIIVTGTKRSGTSMWMQILRAAWLTTFGAAFPGAWKETIHDANPHGFYESHFRRGIYYATNPHPKTGAFLAPESVRNVVVKVFVPGLCRSDIAFVDRVVGTMRDWREYGGSLDRLLTMEAQALEKKAGRPRPPKPRLAPLLEWWLENFLLVRDVATRAYPARLVSYQRVVEEPDVWVPRMLEWLGRGDVAEALACVVPATRTQFAQERPETDLAPHQLEAFDALYAIAHDGAVVTPELIAQLNLVHDELVGAIETQLTALRRTVASARRKRVRGPSEARPATRPPARRPPAAELEMIDAMIARDDAPEPDGEGSASP